MTHLSNGTTVTDIDATATNHALSAQGFTIRHIEDFHGHTSVIHWDRPDTISEAELPF